MEDKQRRATRVVLGAFATLAVLVTGILTFVAPATAAPGDPVWTEMNAGAKIVNANTVRLTDGNTSVEAANLGWEVPFGAPVSFKFELGPGITCVGGAPRVFVEINGDYFNSFDGNVDQCGGTDDKVTFTVPAEGTITHAGVVFDNGQQGWLKVRNLKINGKQVDFTATEPRPEPTATATVSPSTSPTATKSPTAKPTATPSGTAPPTASHGDQPTLPITGTKTNALLGLGAALVLAGVAALVVTRRRNRRRDENENENDNITEYGSSSW